MSISAAVRNGSSQDIEPATTRSKPTRFWSVAAVAIAVVAIAGSVVRDDPEVNADGRLAFVYALVDHRELFVDRFVAQQPLIVEDLAFVGDHYYMAKPPLQSLLAVPVYAGLRTFLPPAAMDSWAWRWVLTLSVSAVALGLLFAVVRATLLAIGAAVSAATHGALIAVLGTPLLVYGSMFMGHALAALLVAFVVLGSIRPQRFFVTGLAHGALLSTELLAAAAASVPFLVFVVGALRRGERSAAAAALTGAAIGGAPMLLYLTAVFGSPLANMYAHIVPEATRATYAAGAYGPPRPEALLITLFSPQQGLFTYAPLALFGLLRFRKQFRGTPIERRAVVLCLATVCAGVVGLASFTLWYDGAQYGPRYLAPFMVLLAWPVAFLPPPDRVAVGILSVAPQVLALLAHQPLLAGTAVDTTYAIVAGRVIFGFLDPNVPAVALQALGLPLAMQLGGAIVCAGAIMVTVSLGRRSL